MRKRPIGKIGRFLCIGATVGLSKRDLWHAYSPGGFSCSRFFSSGVCGFGLVGGGAGFEAAGGGVCCGGCSAGGVCGRGAGAGWGAGSFRAGGAGAGCGCSFRVGGCSVGRLG